MGCGASKSSEPAVFPQNIKPEKQAAGPPQIEGSFPATEEKCSKDHETALIKAASYKNVAGDGNVEPSETQPASSSKVGKDEKNDKPQKPADATLPVPSTNTSQGNTTDRLDSADAANPARAAFRARLQNDNGPSPPQNFKSTRSLNRSIGVRRRGSGEGSESGVPPPPPNGVQPPAAAQQDDAADLCKADEEGAEAAADPLLEEFERSKEANPILVRKVTGNGILSSRGAERSSKSSKRLAVGFAMDTQPSSQPVAVDDDDGAMDVGVAAKQCSSDSAASDASDDLKPEGHLEAPRVGSIPERLEERPAPGVVAEEAMEASGGGEKTFLPVACGAVATECLCG